MLPQAQPQAAPHWCSCKEPKYQINSHTAGLSCGRCKLGFERGHRRRLKKAILNGIKKSEAKSRHDSTLSKYLPTKKKR